MTDGISSFQVNLGLALDFGHPQRSVREQINRYMPLIRLAESLPVGSIWAGESYPSGSKDVRQFHPSSSLLVLAALSQLTSRCLGTGVLLLPPWNALKLAFDVSVITQLTTGGFALGVGLGSADISQRFVGSSRDRGARMDAQLKNLRSHFADLGLGSDERKNSDTGKPVPILVGGAVEASLVRAARYGDGYYGSTSYTATQLRDLIGRYRREVSRIGRDESNARVVVNRLTVVSKRSQDAKRLASSHFVNLLHTYDRIGAFSQDIQTDWYGPNDPRSLEALALVGSQEEVAETLAQYAEAGVTDVVLRVAPGELPVGDALTTLELVAEL